MPQCKQGRGVTLYQLLAVRCDVDSYLAAELGEEAAGRSSRRRHPHLMPVPPKPPILGHLPIGRFADSDDKHRSCPLPGFDAFYAHQTA